MPVTYGIIATCVVVWLLQLAMPPLTNDGSFVPGLAVHEPWRFVTSAFLHDPTGPTHLLFNMFALWTVGGYLERLLGQARFAALYLVSGLGGSVGSLLLATPPDLDAGSIGDWFSPSVGASGAVFGLFLGLLVLDHWRGRPVTPMVVLIGVNAVIGFVYPNIEWQAHLGGALTGAVLAWGMARGARTRSPGLVWSVVLGVVVVLVALCMARYAMVPDLLTMR
ncbi:rhomboid family intramembrane serine protease [Kytococcus sp. Marseille-QA3725]